MMKVLNAEKKRQERNWDSQAKANQRALELMERDRARKQKELAIKIRMENQEKAVQDQKRYEGLIILESSLEISILTVTVRMRNTLTNLTRPVDEYLSILTIAKQYKRLYCN